MIARIAHEVCISSRDSKFIVYFCPSNFRNSQLISRETIDMLKPVKRRRSRSRSRSRRFRCSELIRNLMINLCSAKRWHIELQIMLLHWKMVIWIVLIIFGIHSPMTNIAYVNHVPGERLPDLGFQLIPELSPTMYSISEYLCFFNMISIFVIMILAPFCHKRPRYYSVCHVPSLFPSQSTFISTFSVFDVNGLKQSVFVIRCAAVIASCIVLRCICFLSTSLPGPAPHCQPGSPDYDPPRSQYEVWTRIDVIHGCGDLIFSSHTLMSVAFTLSVYLYAPYYFPRTVYRLWMTVIVSIYTLMAICIIASRKHYTVDVFIAYYTTPLVWHSSYWFWKDLEGEHMHQQSNSKKRKGQGVRLDNIVTNDISLLFPLPKDKRSE